MRIFINALWRATSPSGICRHAATLARALCLRTEIDSVALAVGCWQAEYFENAFNLHHAKLSIASVDIANRATSRNLWYLFGLPRMVEGLEANVVHFSFPAPVIRQRIAVPVVTTLHDLYPYDASSNFGFPHVFGNRVVLDQALRSSDVVACVSGFTLSRLGAVFGADIGRKAVRIYNSVELSGIPEKRPVLASLGERPFLLCVAQHRRNKNIRLLLLGFERMLAQGLVPGNTAMVLLGQGGPETGAILRTITDLSLHANVLLGEGVTDAELVWLYKHCEASLCSSTIEGFGLPLVEAAQCGARVVCSDIPAFREMAGDNCTFFDLADPDPVRALIDACAAALRKPRPPATRNSRLASDAMAAQHIDLYSRLLNRRMLQAA